MQTWLALFQIMLLLYLPSCFSFLIRFQTYSRATNTFASTNVENNLYCSSYLTFVSSNSMKIREVKLLLGDSFPLELRCVNLELEEPQATPIEISQAKCRQAAALCDGPVIVEDTSLCFNALNGLPGPYIKWFYESIGNEGLSKLLLGFEDKTAFAQCVLSFSMGKDQEIKTFVGSVDGIIVSPTGPTGFGWDPIFKPLGRNTTFSQMDRSEKNKISHRAKAFRQFITYVNQIMQCQ